MNDPTTRLGLTHQDRVLIYLVCPVVGLGLGLAFPVVAEWASRLSWVPFQGPFQLIASFDASWLNWGRPLVGLILGLVFAAFIVHESAVLHVTAEHIEVTSNGSTRRIARSDIAGIYRDGSKVVVESHSGRRLYHAQIEGGKDNVRDAFVANGYPWETTSR